MPKPPLNKMGKRDLRPGTPFGISLNGAFVPFTRFPRKLSTYTPYASVTRFRPYTGCVDVNTCGLQHLMKEARDAIAIALENRFLVDLINQAPGSDGRTAGDGATLPRRVPVAR